jgi:hypothetical protein
VKGGLYSAGVLVIRNIRKASMYYCNMEVVCKMSAPCVIMAMFFLVSEKC